MEVRVHELVHDVDVVVVRHGLLRPDHVHDANDVLVFQVPQQLHLPQRALGVHRVLERVGDLLDGNLLVGVDVPCAAHDAVRAFTDGFDGRVPRLNLEHVSTNLKVAHLRAEGEGYAGRVRCGCRKMRETPGRNPARGGSHLGLAVLHVRDGDGTLLGGSVIATATSGCQQRLRHRLRSTARAGMRGSTLGGVTWQRAVV